MLVTLGTALSLSVSPVAHAQSPTPGDTPTPTPSPFCAVLTPAEVKAALKIDATIQDSSDTDCTYADYVTAFVGVDVRVETEDYATIAPLIITDGKDIQVAGRNARIETDGALLYVDTDQGVLALQLVGSAPTGVDAATAMESLGATAVGRLASIPLPTPVPQITPGPAPSFIGDADLVALFPKTIAGKPLQIESRNSDEVLASIDTTDESQAQTLQTLTTALGSQGKSMADLSVATAFSASGGIEALRVKGADMSQLGPVLLPIFLGSMSEPVQSSAQIGGKTVTVITSGENSIYAYPKNDVLWLVFATDPDLTEIFTNLP